MSSVEAGESVGGVATSSVIGRGTVMVSKLLTTLEVKNPDDGAGGRQPGWTSEVTTRWVARRVETNVSHSLPGCRIKEPSSADGRQEALGQSDAA